MSSLFGSIEPFDPAAGGTFSEYHERIEFYFVANNVENEERKKAIFVSVIGPTQYRLLRDLCAPSTIKDKSYQELVNYLKTHHEPQPQMYVERTKFENRFRKPNESINDYVAALRNLSLHCQFGASLDERLCERLVRGVNNEAVQRKLLAEPDLTLKKAIVTAQAMVISTEGAKDLNRETNSSIDHIRKSSTTSFTSTSKQPHHRPSSNSISHCMRCGTDHKGKSCKFIDAECFNCGKIGHIGKMCRSKPHAHQQRSQLTGRNQFNSNLSHRKRVQKCHNLDDNDTSEDDDMYGLFAAQCNTNKAIWVPLQVESETILFQLDTGASTTVITNSTYNDYLKAKTLQPSSTKLKTYTGETVPILGEIQVNVKYHDQEISLPLVVVEGNGPPLFGRNWLNMIKLDWEGLFRISQDKELSEVLSQYSSVFNSNAGLLKDHIQQIHLKQDAIPIYKKARHPPFALRTKIESELERLQKENIIEKVNSSEWATPIVPILKSDGSLRLCGDYKVTVNKVVTREEHPIPKIEELAQGLSHGEKFSSLDFSQAYTHLMLDNKSQEITTINTHCGLYKYKRLPYGISSCPAIFQRTIESVFKDIPNTVIYFDNLYLTGATEKEHLKTLECVLKRCQQKGLNIKKSKCEFFQKEIEFLGYRLTKDGLLPQPKKTEAIKNAPTPKNVHELKAYLGMLNYYAKFLPNISHEIHPLYDLLKKNSQWAWTNRQQKAFDKSKQMLTSDKLLVHYDPMKPVILTCDASPRGISAILSHEFDNGEEKPIAFASRSLDKAEQNYSQLDKEALSLIFGIKKFHKYVFGRHIVIKTDHKPLLGLFGERKPIPEHSSSRVQRWAIMLGAYDYTLQHVPGHRNNADALSRLPLPDTDKATPFPEDLHQVFNALNDTPITSAYIASETQLDPTLQQVYKFCAFGWPNCVSPNLRPYFARKSELSIDNGCVLWGIRVIIPSSIQHRVVSLLHETHVGIVRMKMLARSYVWWPNIDKDLEDASKSCYECQSNRNDPPHAPLHSWIWPTRPWSRIHIDFAGPFLSHMFLVIVDAHSKWIDIKIMSKTTAQATISQLRSVFATNGLPDVIVSDNGATFTSEEFREFTRFNGIQHITSAPWHPSTNGLAERAVGTFKTAMKKMSGGTVFDNVNKFLIKYRTTPQTTTGLTPAELLLGRKIKTRLDLIHDNVQKKVEKSQMSQKLYHDNTSKLREFCSDEKVFIKNHTGSGPKYVSGTIVEQTGPLSYKVLSNDTIRRCHVDQILPNQTVENNNDNTKTHGTSCTNNAVKNDVSASFHQPEREEESISKTPAFSDTVTLPESAESEVSKEMPSMAIADSATVKRSLPETPTLRRSQRTRRKPDRLSYT